MSFCCNMSKKNNPIFFDQKWSTESTVMLNCWIGELHKEGEQERGQQDRSKRTPSTGRLLAVLRFGTHHSTGFEHPPPRTRGRTHPLCCVGKTYQVLGNMKIGKKRWIQIIDNQSEERRLSGRTNLQSIGITKSTVQQMAESAPIATQGWKTSPPW